MVDERRPVAPATHSPDAAGRRAIGRNVLDPAARAGRAQAASVVAEVAEAWQR